MLKRTIKKAPAKARAFPFMGMCRLQHSVCGFKHAFRKGWVGVNGVGDIRNCCAHLHCHGDFRDNIGRVGACKVGTENFIGFAVDNKFECAGKLTHCLGFAKFAELEDFDFVVGTFDKTLFLELEFGSTDSADFRGDKYGGRNNAVILCNLDRKSVV